MTRFSTNVAAGLVLLSASVPRGEASVVPWIGATARFGTYSLANLDAPLDAKVDEIDHGFGFGGDAGLSLSSRVDLALRYERILAGSEVSDATGSLKSDFAADAFYGTWEYRLHATSVPSFGVGAGVGFVSSAGTVELSVPGGGTTGHTDGFGPLFQGYGIVDLAPTSRVSVVITAGYRWAKATSVQIDGTPLFAADGTYYDANYSGLVIAAGLRVHLSRGSWPWNRTAR